MTPSNADDSCGSTPSGVMDRSAIVPAAEIEKFHALEPRGVQVAGELIKESVTVGELGKAGLDSQVVCNRVTVTLVDEVGGG
jgi:hypothetical protein